MKVAHLCLSCFYIDGFGYQENELARQHVDDQHEVLILASTETFNRDGRFSYVSPSEYIGSEGARVVRIPYVSWLPPVVARKVRAYSGVKRILSKFQPNAILFHGACAWELRTVAQYVRSNPDVILYVDSHEDWNNSGRSFLSREMLHRHFYGAALRSSLSAIEQVLCVSTESLQFVNSVYEVPSSYLAFFPLGGRPVEIDEYNRRRNVTRSGLGVDDRSIVFLQTGKMGQEKKLLNSLRAFVRVSDARLNLVISGLIDPSIADEALALIASDHRIRFVGWMNQDDLTDLLCAADIYLQPGTQSATMQHSLCCRCAVAIADVPAHQPYMVENGWFLRTDYDIENAIASSLTSDLRSMQERSFALALDMLDYRAQAQRVLCRRSLK